MTAGRDDAATPTMRTSMTSPVLAPGRTDPFSTLNDEQRAAVDHGYGAAPTPRT